MSSSEEDEVVLLWQYLRRRSRKRRQYWIHPSLQVLKNHGASICAEELKAHPTRFQNCYRMSPNTFSTLVEMLEPYITKQDTNYRDAITPQEKLLITLRYLATGCSFKALTHIFMRGDTTIGLIVKECTKAIWYVLQPLFMPVPTEAIWKSTAQRYYELWDLPNCIGSIDGKHCRIKKFNKTGSYYYNYKSFFSVVLMACANADGLFLTIDVGEAGRMSDGAVFRSSTLGRLLNKEKLRIPKSTPLPNDDVDFPFYFVGDEAFPLQKNLMRPYPQRVLDNEKRIFNYRLSRGRKSIECAFEMLTSKFQIFQRPILCHEDTAIAVIKSACVLHNFIRITEGRFSIPQVTKEVSDSEHQTPTNNRQPNNNNSAYELRDYLKAYFLKPENALAWQGNYTV